MFVSPATLPPRFEQNSSQRPSGLNIGKPSNVTSRVTGSGVPPFTPDGGSLVYSSNWENPTGRNFDLYLVSVKGGTPEPVTREVRFDGFPMFSPDGHWLVFASNRGGKVRGETNLFLARWR